MKPYTLSQSVLNAINATNPGSIKSYTVLYAATMLREWYADNAYTQIAELMRVYHRDTKLVASVAPEQYAKYRYHKDRYDDFWWALHNFEPSQIDRKIRRQRHLQGILPAREVIRRILESHFCKETGTFRFGGIVFG